MESAGWRHEDQDPPLQGTPLVPRALGGVLALLISWSANHSIGWAILHGILGWFYVVYYVIKY